LERKQSLFLMLISVCLVAASGCGSTAYNLGKQSAVLSPVPSASSSAAPLQETPSQASSSAEKANTETPTQTDSPLKIDHLVIVVEENHSYKQVIGNADAPFIQSLVDRGALFTNAHGVTHPSQPNYFALFSGSTQGVTDDSCKKPITAPNLASELMKKEFTFAGYSEDLPKTGYVGCSSKQYARKHNPWAQFTNIPADLNKPFTDFPKDFDKLPTVSFVIPNEKHDMHSGTIMQADDWLKSNLGPYIEWGETHNSALIVTWDEDDFSKENLIPLFFIGPMIKPGKYSEDVDHYSVLKWIEEVYGLPQLGKSKDAKPISDLWGS